MTDSRDHEGHCGFSGVDRKELYRNVLIEFNPWTTKIELQDLNQHGKTFSCLLLTVKNQLWVRNYFLLTYSNPHFIWIVILQNPPFPMSPVCSDWSARWPI